MRTTRSVALVLALLLVAAACSKPKSADQGISAGGSVTVPEVAAPVGGDSTVGDTAATTILGATPGAPAAAAAPPTGGASPALAPTEEQQSQARAVGELIQPQSTTRGSAPPPGVSDDAIKLIFSMDETSCGVNVISAITAAGGALPTTSRYYRAAPTNQNAVVAEQRESIDLMVKEFNASAFEIADYLPHVRPLMGDDPNNQFFGRHLEYEIVDGGSNQCPEKTTAASKEAIEKNAFIVYNNFDGAQYNMAASLSAEPPGRRPMHFGTLWLSDQDYSRFAPFAWTQFSTGSTITRQYASWICSRVATGAVPARSPMVTDPAKRKFGLVHTNAEQDVRLANELKGYLKQFCGLDPFEIAYEGTDFGKAQQDNANVIIQLKLAGVTSVMMLTEPIQPLFQMQHANQQDYHPEWMFSSFGYSDSNTVMRLYDQGQMANAFGTTNLGVPGGFGFGAGDPFRLYHDSHKVAPSGTPCDPSSDEGMNHDEKFCKAPGALVTWYYTMLPSIGGMIFAGPDLTADNVTKGLQAFPSTRYGGAGPTADPRPALVGAGPGNHGFIVDATEWRWRPDFTSPKPEAKAGWIEYPDCQRHYLQWPDALAPNWEKDGPHYNAWCGDENGYPRVLPEDSNG